MDKAASVTMALVMSLMFMGCALSGKSSAGTGEAPAQGHVKSVSVPAFTGADSAISRDVQNAVIEVLLEHYSIVVGAEADAVIEGVISLSSGGGISSITARVLRDGRVIDTAEVAPSAAWASPGSMGRELGRKLTEIMPQ